MHRRETRNDHFNLEVYVPCVLSEFANMIRSIVIQEKNKV